MIKAILKSIIVITAICIIYKSPFDWNPHHPIQRLQQATHRNQVKLVSGWIFGGYSLGSSCDFTEVRPVLAAGGRLVHLQEPHAESLETDLGTIFKLLIIKILVQNNCSFFFFFFFVIFHVMWPSDSKPAGDCIRWMRHTSFFNCI